MLKSKHKRKDVYIMTAGRFTWLMVALLAFGAAAQQPFTDTRDGKVYKTVTIGGKRWFAENLNYDVPNTKTDVCLDNNAEHCAKYGRMYDWETAVKACPAGWRLPFDEDWTELINSVGGKSTAGMKLKSKTGWYGGGGTDNYGFAALPGGINSRDGGFVYEYMDMGDGNGGGTVGVWVSATIEGMKEGNAVWVRQMWNSNKGVHRTIEDASSLFSVRCVCVED
jgi:uncharacterized protein (TIGR02145 family)